MRDQGRIAPEPIRLEQEIEIAAQMPHCGSVRVERRQCEIVRMSDAFEQTSPWHGQTDDMHIALRPGVERLGIDIEREPPRGESKIPAALRQRLQARAAVEADQ